MYCETTEGIEVSVLPVYIDERSDPGAHRFFWAYQVQIENKSNDTVQLINRYWNITDGNGLVEEVHGPGVVGQNPVLAPGERYEYTSGCPLATPSGIMVGHYEMQRSNGEMMIVRIPAFSLDLPDVDPSYN
jgi:ApaG protein